MSQVRNDAGVAGGPAPGNQMSQQNLNQIVIEYLSKKGYTRTEAMLRVESGSQNSDGSGTNGIITAQTVKWASAMELMERWVETVLDIYKPELQRLLWPIFVYCYIKSIGEDWTQRPDATILAEQMITKYKNGFETEHGADLSRLQSIRLKEHLSEQNIAKTFLDNKYRFTLSTAAYAQLILFLESKHSAGGAQILKIITENMELKSLDRVAADHNVVETILGRNSMASQWPAEDEGIPGHNPGQYAGAPSAIMTKLRLGPLPMEPLLMDDVLAELEEEDAKDGTSGGPRSLVNEFKNRIKQEETDDNPLNRSDLPLPASRARDVQMEVLKTKEHRDRFRIDLEKDKLSVCMYTFHNTQDTVNCVVFSDDHNLIAIGTSEHYIRVFTADGSPLPSIRDEQKSASARLIGHSGPVFNLSFSPAVENPNGTTSFTPAGDAYTGSEFLLSCSFDRTIRLWHLGLMKQIMVYKAHLGPVMDVTWGPFGHYFVSAGHDRKAQLWSTAKASPLRWFVGHDNSIDKCCFHPNGAYVFTAASDRTIRMFSCLNGACVRLFTSHTGYPTAIACSPTGKILASADDHGVILLWDLALGKLIKRMKGHDRGGIWSLSWNADGNMLMSGGADGTVRLWDVMKMDNIGAQSKIVGEGGAGTRIDGGVGSGPTGASSAVNANVQGKKKGKGLQVSADQVSAFPTKQTPVMFVKFTRMNLGIAVGRYEGGS